MKRIGAILCLCLTLALLSAPFCFAAAGDLQLSDTYPEDGAKGTAVENASVKLFFNQQVHPKSDAIRKANKKAVRLTNNKGKEIPIYVAYNPDVKGQVMILSGKSVKIEGNTQYTLTIGPEFQATNGDTLGKQATIKFKTLNQSQTMTVNMVMMGVMMVGMIFFSMKSMKKQQEKEKAAKGKQEPVNPYKEAKRTGKSVEEIVERDRKNKEKLAAAEAKKAARKKKEEETGRTQLNPENKRVAGPRPISAAGSTFKVAKKKKPAPSQANKNKQGTTRPKNQTGKQKNSKNKKK